jgi:hypothetical protein
MENEKKTSPPSRAPVGRLGRAARRGRRSIYCRVERDRPIAILPFESVNPATMLNRQVEHAVEILCHQGCQAVWGVINALERGETLPETAGLEAYEVQAVIGELKAIMAVYAGSCGVPD